MDLDLLTIKSALELFFSISVANAILIFIILLGILSDLIDVLIKKWKLKKAKKE